MRELQQRVGRNVRAHRAGTGLGQDAYAARIGMHRSLIGRIETGDRNLTLQSVERLAAALEVDSLDLLAP